MGVVGEDERKDRGGHVCLKCAFVSLLMRHYLVLIMFQYFSTGQDRLIPYRLTARGKLNLTEVEVGGRLSHSWRWRLAA